MNPLVSVIIPAYNAAPCLAATIASVQHQTFSDWELVVIDDGSTDDTIEIMTHLAHDDDRLHLHSQANQGVAVARNQGVAQSRGTFLAFLDADDCWYPDKLTRHVNQLQHQPSIGVSFDRVAFLDAQAQPTGTVSTAAIHQLEPARFLYENPTTTTSSWVVRRQAFDEVGGFTPGMSYAEDLEWLFRCSLRWQVEGLDAVLTGYRTSTSGLSADLYRMEAGWQALIDRARTYAPDLVNQHYPLAQAVHLRYLARRALRLKTESHIAKDFISRSLQSDWRVLLQQPHRTLFTLAAAYLARGRA